MKFLKNIILYVKENGFLAFILKLSDIILSAFGISLLSLKSIKRRDFRNNPYTKNSIKKNSEIFSDIYNNKYWLKNESLSGSGSDLENLGNYYKSLSKFFNNYEIESIFDTPCGDFIFMDKFLNGKKVNYLGGDIVQNLISDNKKKFCNYNFIKFDLIEDRLNGYFDVVHIKDCLIHFSIEDIEKALKNIVTFDSKFTLITSHKSVLLKNIDIKTGEFRYLDLEKSPFYLPKPIERLKDYKFGFRKFPRFVCVWRTEDLRMHIKK